MILTRHLPLLGLTASLALIWGCSEGIDEPAAAQAATDSTALPLGPDGRPEMRFSAAMAADAESRGDESVTPLTTDYSVWTTAVYEDTDVAQYHYFGSATPLKLDALAAGCFAATGYYFPFSGQMHFLAYAANCPAGSTPSVSVSPTTLSVGLPSRLSFNLLTTGYTGTYEVAYADPVTAQCEALGTAPTLHFHHTQANLRFRFEPVDQATCDHVRINYILVEQVKVRGLLNINHANTDPVDWSSTVTADWKVANLTGSEMTMANGLDAGNGIYIVPQDTRNRIIINYTMRNGDGYPAEKQRTMNYVINEPPGSGLKWERGYQYNYLITVKGNYQMEFRDIEVQLISDGHTGTMHI